MLGAGLYRSVKKLSYFILLFVRPHVCPSIVVCNFQMYENEIRDLVLEVKVVRYECAVLPCPLQNFVSYLNVKYKQYHRFCHE